MSYKFSHSSKIKLETCHPDLQKLFTEVLKCSPFDLTVVEGVRTLERQKQLLAEGATKTLASKHIPGNDGYSRAVDVAIWKQGQIDWSDSKAYYVLAGVVFSTAKRLGINIRWGGDWDKDLNFNDQTFDDLVHYELI